MTSLASLAWTVLSVIAVPSGVWVVVKVCTDREWR